MSELMIEKSKLPIVVNYDLPIYEMIKRMQLAWLGSLPGSDKIIIRGSGKKSFCIRSALVVHGCYFPDVKNFFSRNSLEHGRAEHLFALGGQHRHLCHPKMGRRRIIEGGTTWLDSHECLDEMLGWEWDPFYHHPGPSLGVVVDLGMGTRYGRECPFLPGDRFIAIEE